MTSDLLDLFHTLRAHHLRPVAGGLTMAFLVLNASGDSARARQRAPHDENVDRDSFKETSQSPRLLLAWFDPGERLPLGFEILSDEVDSIFRTLGVEIEWKRSSSPTTVRTPGDLLVLLLPKGPVGWREEGHVMGATRLGDRPVIRLYLVNVARTLGARIDAQRRIPPGRPTVEMARALGRILAHEVIHAVAPPHPHANSGVFTRRLTRRGLTRNGLSVDPSCSVALLAALNTNPRMEGLSSF